MAWKINSMPYTLNGAFVQEWSQYSSTYSAPAGEGLHYSSNGQYFLNQMSHTNKLLVKRRGNDNAKFTSSRSQDEQKNHVHSLCRIRQLRNTKETERSISFPSKQAQTVFGFHAVDSLSRRMSARLFFHSTVTQHSGKWPLL